MIRANPIRFVALDLDQTVFGIDLVIAPRVQAGTSNAKTLGMGITIAETFPWHSPVLSVWLMIPNPIQLPRPGPGPWLTGG